jgi:hypothetical protein
MVHTTTHKRPNPPTTHLRNRDLGGQQRDHSQGQRDPNEGNKRHLRPGKENPQPSHTHRAGDPPLDLYMLERQNALALRARFNGRNTWASCKWLERSGYDPHHFGVRRSNLLPPGTHRNQSGHKTHLEGTNRLRRHPVQRKGQEETRTPKKAHPTTIQGTDRPKGHKRMAVPNPRREKTRLRMRKGPDNPIPPDEHLQQGDTHQTPAAQQQNTTPTRGLDPNLACKPQKHPGSESRGQGRLLGTNQQGGQPPHIPTGH